MQSNSWVSLFRRIPVNLHNTLAVSVITGSEIVLQDILRIEAEFLIVRGRLAGTNDTGRVVILPYANIINLSFTKRMTEQEVQGVFGQTMGGGEAASSGASASSVADDVATPAATAETADPGPAADLSEPAHGEEPAVEHGTTISLSSTALRAPEEMPAAAAGEKEKPKPVSKSLLLARLRQRLAEQKPPLR